MRIDTQQKKLLIEELTIGLPAAAWTLRAERRKFSAHLLRVASMRHVYETLSEVAENLDILNVTLIDLFLTEGIEMDEKTKEMEQQIGRQAAHPATALEAGAAPAALGMRNVVTQLDRLQEKLETALGKLDLIDTELALLAKWCGARQIHLELVEQKFTGIGKAIDVIAQTMQKNMTGKNGDPNDNEQGG